MLSGKDLKGKRSLRLRSYKKNRSKVVMVDRDGQKGLEDSDPLAPARLGSGEGGSEGSSVEVVEVNSPWEINPDLTRLKARELYVCYRWSKQRISESLGVPDSTLQYWIYKPTEGRLSWHQERELAEDSIMDAVKQNIKGELVKIAAHSMSILRRSIAEKDFELAKYDNPR